MRVAIVACLVLVCPWAAHAETEVTPNRSMQEVAPAAAPADPHAGVLTAHLKGFYGATWLGDGVGLGKLGVTSARGLGLGIMYSFHRYVAVEAEIMGARTGEARFHDLTWDGMQDLVRSAWYGRGQLGGVLRVGSNWWQPALRAGVGLQGGVHSAHIEIDGARFQEEDLPFEWSKLYTIGAGLDLRLAALRAGVALSVVTPFGDLGNATARRTIEAGAHIGMRWD